MAALNHPVVAISSEFMNAFAAIPKKMQSKVLEFITKFRSNPMAPGINYEKITQFKDRTLRSVRIDDTYRGIIKKPDTGNVYMLLWVDHHDKAYEWARNKKCTIHRETGSLQVYEVDEIAENASVQKIEDPKGLFADIHNRHLVKIGIPEEMLPLVRAICTEEQLDTTADQLPSEAHEALTALAAGFTLDEVLNEYGVLEDEKIIDITDYVAALKNPDSRRRFVVIENDLELQEILGAPLEKWRVFLHPSQRNIVEKEWNGPVRILGGAGTGKTVVAVHRAKYLAEHIFTQEHDRILLTTFTRNLAADIKENLSKICPDRLMRRIEIINLDRWVAAFLKKNDYTYEIDYGKRTKYFWDKAITLTPSELGLPDSFYREEWERVIQPQAITSFFEYVKASRIGRGVRLSRPDRKAIWPVFEEYRLLLNEHNLREVDDAMRDACALIKEKGDILPYRAVIVDEAQDMGTQAFKLIRQIAGQPHGNDLFIVGDAHQRIYRHKIALGQCGINIIGRGRKLRINYRTTEENRRWAVGLLRGADFDDLDGGLDDQKGYKSLLHGSLPVIEHFHSFQAEVAYITDCLKTFENSDENLNQICLVARTHELLNQYDGALKSQGFDTYSIRRNEPEDRRIPGVRLATMHRVKGLEFDRIIIAGVNEGIVPLNIKAAGSSDKIITKENETKEKALLYVAATRAKKSVWVTSFDHPSGFLLN